MCLIQLFYLKKLKKIPKHYEIFVLKKKIDLLFAMLQNFTIFINKKTLD